MKLAVSTSNNIFNGKLKYLSRFSMVGAANTFIDFAIFTLLNSLFNIDYAASQFLGYGCGIANSFIFNKKWTFQDRKVNKKTTKELLQFVVVNLVTLIITIAAINLLVESFHLNVYISKIIVTIIAQITNFIAYKLWVFN